MDNAQMIVREDSRNFKDFADWIVPLYAAQGKKVAQITNLDAPEDMGAGGPVVDLAATIEEQAESPSPVRQTKRVTKKTPHSQSKLPGGLGGDVS